jgi:hypothetical protein
MVAVPLLFAMMAMVALGGRRRRTVAITTCQICLRRGVGPVTRRHNTNNGPIADCYVRRRETGSGNRSGRRGCGAACGCCIRLDGRAGEGEANYRGRAATCGRRGWLRQQRVGERVSSGRQ